MRHAYNEAELDREARDAGVRFLSRQVDEHGLFDHPMIATTVGTGGGCDAFCVTLPTGNYILITGDDANVPRFPYVDVEGYTLGDESLVVGLYRDDDDGAIGGDALDGCPATWADVGDVIGGIYARDLENHLPPVIPWTVTNGRTARVLTFDECTAIGVDGTMRGL